MFFALCYELQECNPYIKGRLTAPGEFSLLVEDVALQLPLLMDLWSVEHSGNKKWLSLLQNVICDSIIIKKLVYISSLSNVWTICSFYSTQVLVSMSQILILIPSWERRFGRWAGVIQYGFWALWMRQWSMAMPIQHWWRRLLQDLSLAWGQGNVWERATRGKVSTITWSAVHYRCVMTVTTQCLRAILTVCNLLLSQRNKILKKAEAMNMNLTKAPMIHSKPDMRLPQLCCQGSRSCGMWCCITRLVFPDILKKCIAYIISSAEGPAHTYSNRQTNVS